MTLVAGLDRLFTEVTGEHVADTIPRSEPDEGPFVQLVAAVAAHIREKLDIVDPDQAHDVGLGDVLSRTLRHDPAHHWAHSPSPEVTVGIESHGTGLDIKGLFATFSARSPRSISWPPQRRASRTIGRWWLHGP